MALTINPATGGRSNWQDSRSLAEAFGIGALSLRETFSGAMAKRRLDPVKQYIFGTNTYPADGVTPVRDLNDLALYFNAFESGTDQQTINGEIQRYMPFSAGNHIFGTDRLNLKATLPGGAWATQVTTGSGTINLNGTSTVIANLGLANTTGLRVGQLVAVRSKGTYYISALVTDTSVTLTALANSPTSSVSGGLLVWLPIDSAVTTTTVNSGGTVLTFGGGVPAAVANGMQLGYVNSGQVLNRNADYRVQSFDATTVTLTLALTSLTLASGTRILFFPAINSAQIWTKDTYDITSPDYFFATEGEFNLFNGPGSADYDINGIATAAAYASVPTDFPWGGFLAFWCFGADPDGLFQSNTSEADIAEMYMSTTNGPRYWLGNNSGSNTNFSSLFQRLTGGWVNGSSGFQISPTSLAGNRKFSFIYHNGKTYRFIDDYLVKADWWEWYSTAPLQVGVNLSTGSISSNYGANIMFPMAPANFDNMNFAVKSLKFWYRQ